MKKIIANLLVFILAVNMFLFTVYGEATTVHSISETGVTTIYGTGHFELCQKANNYSEQVVNLWRTDSYAKYKLDVPKDGAYNIEVYLTGYSSASALSVDVNEFRISDNINAEYKGAGSGYPDWKNINLGNYDFTKGINALTLTSTENVYIKEIKIKYVGEMIEPDVKTIYVENAITYGNNNNLSTSPMADEASVWFEVNIPEDGYYALTTSSYAATDASNYEVYKNSISDANRILDGKIDIDYTGAMTETAPTLLNISQDDTLILLNNGEGNKLYGIRLEKIMSASEANAFMSELKNLKGPDSLKELMASNSYFKNNTSKIFYSRWLYEELYEKKNASTLNEFFQEWSAVSAKVEASPDVTLWNNGENVTKPGRGLNTVKVNLGVSRGTKVIAAMYENNTLIDSIIEDSSATELTLNFTVPVTGDNAVCKVFFWDGLDNITPINFLDMYNIYVSPAGRDTNNGTKIAPFKTIEKAKEYASSISANMKKDIVVNIASGEYFLNDTLTFDAEDSGKNGNNIIFRGIGATKPLISGGVKVGSNWTDSNSDGIWEIQVPEIAEARQMYINGFAAERAKSDKLYTPDETLYSDGDTTYTYDGFVTTSYDFPDFAHPEEMEVVANIKWAMFRMPIEDITYRSATGDTLFEMKQPYYNSNITLPRSVTGVLPITGYRFYLENAIELLDKEGEFYFDKRTHTLYYKPISGQNLSTAEVYLPKTEGIMNIIGTTANKVSNIRFENLDFRHGAFNDATARGASFVQSDCRVDPTRANQSWASVGLTNKSQIHIENAKNIAITDCNISNLGSAGIGMVDNVSDSEIKRNTIHDISATSILVGHWRTASLSADTICNNITIENNIITRTGQEFMGSSAMAVYYAKNVKILHNEISETPYTGLTVGWGWGATGGQAYGSGNHKIMYNKISSTSKMMRDGGDIYTLGYLAGTEISKNYLIGNNDMASIYLDNGTANVTVSNNVCKDFTEYSRGWLYVNSGATNNVASNNYVDADKYQVSSSATNTSVSGTTTFADDNFTGDALSVINNAGIENSVNLSVPARPSSLKTVYDYVPQTEQVESGDILIEAENTESYQYINAFPTDSDRGRKAATLGKQDGNYMRYKINVPKSGTYRLEVRMSATQESTDQTEDFTLKVKHGKYSVYLSNQTQKTKPVNYIAYGLYHSCYVADLTLSQSTSYYIQIENLSDKVINIDNFKLIYQD